jgi:hypothetical protein
VPLSRGEGPVPHRLGRAPRLTPLTRPTICLKTAAADLTRREPSACPARPLVSATGCAVQRPRTAHRRSHMVAAVVARQCRRDLVRRRCSTAGGIANRVGGCARGRGSPPVRCRTTGRSARRVIPRGYQGPRGQKCPICSENEKSPAFAGLSQMRRRGLEPPRALQPTRPSTLRVYQFRHRRSGAPSIARA